MKKQTTAELNVEFQEHCRANEIQSAQLLELMPLVHLIKPLQEIVENQKAATIIGKKIIKIITITAVVIGLIISILELWKRIR